MRLKLTPKLIPAALVVAIAVPTYSQSAPTARQGGWPIVVGAALSDYSIDWGPSRRMVGITAWVDWLPSSFPGALRGFGIEATGHGIDYNVPAGISKMRQDSAEGGPIYSFNPYHGLRPYVKFEAGVGSIDFPPLTGAPSSYTHDTFLVTSPGGGAEYHIWQHLCVRADYEYQFWHETFGPHDLTPNGFTVGASYDFRPLSGVSR